MIGCDACPAPNELLVNAVTLSSEILLQDDDGSSKMEMHLLPRQDEATTVVEAHLFPVAVSM